MTERIPTAEETIIDDLGPATYPSPVTLRIAGPDASASFIDDSMRVRYSMYAPPHDADSADISFQAAGPRTNLYFQPTEVTAAIVTCGGLCPGLNDVIRSITMQLWNVYEVRNILGIRYGYEGLNPAAGGMEPIVLTPELVERIHVSGGTILGSSRGPQPPEAMVDFLIARGINILFCVGGDGTQKGAMAIHDEATRRGLKIAVVGVPKTIDNDIMFVQRTFGYSTAVARACEVVVSAHDEAKGARNGISIVRLMGRDSGFIAAGAAVVSQEANYCLIPEVPFALHGPNGLLEHLHKRILRRSHAVIIVAEGAGQDLLAAGPPEIDASGNRLHKDIGTYLRDQVLRYFQDAQVPIAMKYLDPSYFIRSARADAEDSLLCERYARSAVHAAMAGKTGMCVSYWNNTMTHVPIQLITSGRKRLNPNAEFWFNVLISTGQPPTFSAE